MVKYTQTIRRQLFQCVRPFCGFGTERVNQFHTTDLILITSETSKKQKLPLMFSGSTERDKWHNIVEQ